MNSENIHTVDHNKRAGNYAYPVDYTGAPSQNYIPNRQFSQGNHLQGQASNYQGYPTQGQMQQEPVMAQPSSMNQIILNPGMLQGTGLPIAFGRNPQSVQCPYCRQFIHTDVDSRATNTTHLYALLLCCLCCCCCLPYCIDSCQSQHHFCPNCRAFLGEHRN